MEVAPELRRIADVHRRGLRAPRAWLAGSVLALAAVVAIHWGRSGTLTSRVGAVAVLALGTIVVVWLLAYARWQCAKVERIIGGIVRRAQPELGAKLLRAYRLAHASPSDEQVSKDLSQLYYARTLAQVSDAAVVRRARSHASLLRRLAWLAFAGAALGTVFAPIRALEGLDVLLAEGDTAPLRIVWLERVQIEALPPAYLRQNKLHLMMDSASALPEGTQLTFRGRRRYSGRQLYLTDGGQKVPFVDEGSGQVVARWELAKSVELFVASRFGEVFIREPSSVVVHAVPDEAPRVELAGAPAAVELDQMDRLELHWSAVDDHSLVQVELVLRSAGREERRPLERYPGDKRSGSGGHVLFPDDPFFQRLFLPALVTIQARDDDPRHGSKWGSSEAITVRPPGVGSPAASRYRALIQLRNRWASMLSERHALERVEAMARGAARRVYLDKLQELEAESHQILGATYGGLALNSGWINFARAQIQLVMNAHRRQRDELKVSEDVLLALDGALENLATSDARRVSKQLGDVAEEAALASHMAQTTEERQLGLERLDIAISVLQLGADELRKLGALGEDLGSVAEADLGRVIRSRQREDLLHAELAALHMAARLHRPNPSFGSKGGGGGGVEGGPGMSGGSGGDASGSPSQAEAKFDRAAQDLQRLAEEHADSVARSSDALQSAREGIKEDGLSEEAAERARQLRESVLRLPQPGAAPGSGRASAALAREHAGAMAHELERLGLDEAIESGRRARAAAEEALRLGGLSDFTESELRGALQQLELQLRWAEEQQSRLSQLRQQAAQQSLKEIAKWEADLAERARRMVEDASQEGGVLPKEILERLQGAEQLMQQAARHLDSGQGEAGLELQRRAQRLLEESETGEANQGDQGQHRPSSGNDSRGPAPADGGDVPDASESDRAEEFRRRVLEGLAQQNGGRLSPAVRRYAEGLLR